MLHYYFLKYWSRILVGSMVSLVVIVFGLFSYSLNASQRERVQRGLESGNSAQSQAYLKSANLFTKIQELKVKKQDTSQLEALYSSSVQNLSNQHPEAAVSQLNQLETQIAKINENLVLTPSPLPTEIIASISGILSPSLTPPQPSVKVDGTVFTSTGSAEIK
jgi:hypothetical protein